MESRKLFVGGLPPFAQADELREHFGRYGEVLAVRVVRDRETGHARGFAFVEFADDAAAQSALDDAEAPNHVFGGCTVHVKRARVRLTGNDTKTEQIFYPPNTYQSLPHSQCYNQSSPNIYQSPVHMQWYNINYGNGNGGYNPKKVFVGGLHNNVTKEELKSYFQKFGTINDAVVIEDASTHKSRGFGFVTFGSDEAMKKVMENTFHNLNGTQVEVKIAIPRVRRYHPVALRYDSNAWDQRRPHRGYVGMYQPLYQPYIFNTNCMVPAHTYVYSPHATQYCPYMINNGMP